MAEAYCTWYFNHPADKSACFKKFRTDTVSGKIKKRKHERICLFRRVQVVIVHPDVPKLGVRALLPDASEYRVKVACDVVGGLVGAAVSRVAFAGHGLFAFLFCISFGALALISLADLLVGGYYRRDRQRGTRRWFIDTNALGTGFESCAVQAIGAVAEYHKAIEVAGPERAQHLELGKDKVMREAWDIVNGCSKLSELKKLPTNSRGADNIANGLEALNRRSRMLADTARNTSDTAVSMVVVQTIDTEGHQAQELYDRAQSRSAGFRELLPGSRNLPESGKALTPEEEAND